MSRVSYFHDVSRVSAVAQMLKTRFLSFQVRSHHCPNPTS